MTRLRDWSNADQERHRLPAGPEPIHKPRAVVIERLTGLLSRVANELEAVPEDERELVLDEAVARANGQE